jgi:hypothetical protein
MWAFSGMILRETSIERGLWGATIAREGQRNARRLPGEPAHC